MGRVMRFGGDRSGAIGWAATGVAPVPIAIRQEQEGLGTNGHQEQQRQANGRRQNGRGRRGHNLFVGCLCELLTGREDSRGAGVHRSA